MSEEELKRFKEEQKYKNELFNDFAIDSWCEESETINRAINRLTKEHFSLLDIKEFIDKHTAIVAETGTKYLVTSVEDDNKLINIINEALGDKENE